MVWAPDPPTPARSTVASTLVAAVISLLVAACGQADASEAEVVIRRADDVQVVDPAEAEALLEAGRSRVGRASRTESSPTETTLSVTEANRSFQVRLGTALTVFNTCLGDLGFTFVGIPGQTDDPAAADPGYLPALISCNNESGIGSILTEQQARQAALTADQKAAINEAGRTVFECLIDRGWDLGELVPNQNGILTASRFPDVPPSRSDEFQRDLDECGWNDLDLG